MIDDIEAKLDCIPADDYATWCEVGMALKHEGYDCETWDAWSRRSSKYVEGVCERKWRSFNEGNAGEPVTGGTIEHLAIQNGYEPDDYGEELVLGQLLKSAAPTKGYKFIDKSSERENLPEFDTGRYDPKADAIAYLEGMFEPDEVIGFNGEFEAKGDRLVPVTNMHSFTAGQTIADMKSGPMKRMGVDDLREQAVREAFGVVGDHGCYVRINPLDGHGDGNSNVTRFANALIESDEDDIETQYAIYRKLELPIRFLVHSGNHSLHAVVKVDALNIHEYRERVSFLYAFCSKNGLKVDEANKNPSRYSRMPGVRRGSGWQYIVARDIGKSSWDEWREWVEEANDTLPEEVAIESFDDLPPLAPELIEGILREGHKMLLAAPSKAGKSFMLEGLCVCVGEGIPWLGHAVKQGKVLYVNLELDPLSCAHRFKDIYDALGIGSPSGNVRVLNLRGRSVPLDKLAPTIIRRFKGKGYVLIVIDPIYKVITGDENAASDMAAFCNLFDAIATECECSVAYSHHYSKGANAKYRNASDRASGSGVFTRDPDAILSMSELSVDAEKIDAYKHARNRDGDRSVPSGWRISSTLREFPTPPDFDIWFDWPLHVCDKDVGNILGTASEADAPGDTGVGKKQMKRDESVRLLKDQYDMLRVGTPDNAVRFDDMMTTLGFSESKIKNVLQDIDWLMQATLDVGGEPVRVIARKFIAMGKKGDEGYTEVPTSVITFGNANYIPKLTKLGNINTRERWRPVAPSR